MNGTPVPCMALEIRLQDLLSESVAFVIFAIGLGSLGS